MILKKFLIAGGNSTLLAWNCPPMQKDMIVRKYLGQVEQVGFIAEKKFPKLIMMGNELCINSTLALASQLSKSGLLKTSGITKPIYYENNGNNTSIELALPFEKKENIILFSGIGFLCSDKVFNVSKEYLSNLVIQFNLPAFGVVFYQGNKITPYVYVRETDSLFKETACGSGSIACSLVTDYEEIIQPTGEIIYVKTYGNKFTVGAKVVKIGESYE